MASRARFLVFAPLAAAILQACSSDNSSSTTDASDGGASDAPGADVARQPGPDGAVDSSTAPDGTSDAKTSDGTTSDGTTSDADAGTPPDAGADGDGATACSTPVYTHVSTFTSIFDGWVVAPNSSSELVPGTSSDGAMTGTLVELDPTAGSPALGSAKLTIPFSMPGETLLFALNSATPLNLTGTTVTAQVRLDSGFNTSPLNPGQAFLVLKSTSSYIYAQANPTYLDPSAGWVTLTLDPDSFAATTFGYTACDIREIDLVLQTGNMGTYTTAVVHIDTIAVTAPAGDGGSGDGASTDAPSDTAVEGASSDAPSEGATDATGN